MTPICWTALWLCRRGPPIAELALYALGIAKNQLFIGGSKWYVPPLPAPDGRAFTVGNVEAAVMTLEMASDDLSEGEFTAWVRIHARYCRADDTG